MLSLCCLAAGPRRELWVYANTNLAVDANVDRLTALLHRAHAAGYDHLLLSDSKLARLDALGDLAPRYTANLGRLKRAAAAEHVAVVPSVFSVGYSNDLLSHDPNLAEGVPVRDAPFVVRGNVATPANDPPVAFAKVSFKDDAVTIGADGTATVRETGGNARFVYSLAVPKFRCYHVAVKVRSADFHGDARVAVLADGKPLNFEDFKVEPTQDWAAHDVVFDTLDHDKVQVYFGVWGGVRGSLRWKDWRVEPAGLVNVLRRAGTPCVVAGYAEGKDYDPIADPRLGNVPYAGEYTAWHDVPPVRTRGIADGTTLRVSWYYPPVVGGGQVMICPSDPKTTALLADQARLVRAAFGSAGYMMAHDEVRCLNWDESCQRRHLDAGPVLAENLRACTGLLGGSTAYVWSDMFDPTHNAHGDYYLVRGNLADSWAGLGKDVVVVNWNYDHRDASLKFFADRGNRQLIAGYYDDPARTRDWVASADKVPGVVGFMYTTWVGNYADLERFAADVARASRP